MDEIVRLAKDERTARIVLATLTEPRDTTTGPLLRRVGGAETVRLLNADTATAPGLDEATVAVWRGWRAQLNTRANADTVRASLKASDQIATLIPGDTAWPAGFAALEDQTPYALWVEGDPGVLSSPLRTLVTVTVARAATGTASTSRRCSPPTSLTTTALWLPEPHTASMGPHTAPRSPTTGGRSRY